MKTILFAAMLVTGSLGFLTAVGGVLRLWNLGDAKAVLAIVAGLAILGVAFAADRARNRLLAQ